MKEFLISCVIVIIVGSMLNANLQLQPVANSNYNNKLPDSSLAYAKAPAIANNSAYAASPESGVASTSEATFDRDVLRSQIPVLVDFSAVWCGPCKRMAPIVEAFAREHRGELRVFKCDIDENKTLSNRWRVEAVPTFIVFRNGKPVGIFTGATSKEDFESQINPLLQ